MNRDLKKYLSRVNEQFTPIERNWVTRRVSIDSTVQNAVECLTSHSPVCLLGDPGAGKTTVLQMVTLTAAKGLLGHEAYPFFIRAASAPEVSNGLADWISKAAQLDFNADFIKPLLNNEHTFVIIDGLDELSHNQRETTINRLSHWITEYPRNKWILSSRPIGFPGDLGPIDVARLMDLSAEEIELITRKLLPEDDHAIHLANSITTQRDLASLATSPFLLSLIIEIYRYQKAIPTARADLYSSWTDIALRQWDKSRGIGRRENYLSLELTRKGLEALALQLSIVKRAQFELSEWLIAIDSIYESGEDIWRQAELTFFENVLGSGLVREVAARVFAFAHLTLQEYFAALALLRMETGAALEQLDKVPREVAAFYAESTRDPMQTAHFLVSQGRFDDVRRLVDSFPNLSRSDREEIVALMAEKLGVNDISFRKPIVADSPISPDENKTILRNLWLQCHGDLSSQEKGKRFEQFAEKLFGLVFEVVDVRRLTTFGEIDIICEVKADSFWIRWPGDCFVECKNYGDKVAVSIANEFIGKCSTVRVRLAFLVSAGPLTNPSRDRISRSWSQADVPDMAWLDGDDIENWLENDHDAERLMKSIVRRASYGTN